MHRPPLAADADDRLRTLEPAIYEGLDRLRDRPGSEEELERARENVKARVVLALESTGARMNRLGSSLLFGLPLLEPEEVMARIDAVSAEDVESLARELLRPERLSAAAVGEDEDAFRAALEG